MLRITLQTSTGILGDRHAVVIDFRLAPLVVFLGLFHLVVGKVPPGYLHSSTHPIAAHVRRQHRKTNGETCDPSNPSRQIPADTATTSRSPVILSAGQQANVIEDGRGIVVHTNPVDPNALLRALQWREGHIVFSGEPLARVVEEFNRYNRAKLVIRDDAIVNIKVVGPFRVTDVDELLAFLRTRHGIVATTMSSSDGHPRWIALAGPQQSATPHRNLSK